MRQKIKTAATGGHEKTAPRQGTLEPICRHELGDQESISSAARPKPRPPRQRRKLHTENDRLEARRLYATLPAEWQLCVTQRPRMVYLSLDAHAVTASKIAMLGGI